MITESPKQETRRQILESLKFSGPQTSKDLNTKFALSLMAIRQHLITLESDGFFLHWSEKRGAGWPSFVYSLTIRGDTLFPRSYAQLTNELVDIIRELDGEAAVDRIFKHRTAQLEALYRMRMPQDDLKGQVQELALIRSEEGFLADWEQLDDEAYVLRERNNLSSRLQQTAARFAFASKSCSSGS